MAAEHKLPVKIVLLNNGVHGMVRQWQDLFYESRYSASILGKMPDFVKLADAYGIKGLRALKPSEVEASSQGGAEAQRAGADGYSHRSLRKLLPDDSGRRGAT